MRALGRPLFTEAMVFLVQVAVGCHKPGDPPISISADTSGAMVMSHGNHLCRIGGEAEGGTVSGKTMLYSGHLFD